MNYDTQATSFIAAGRAKSSLPFFMRLGLPGLIAPQEFFSCQVMVRHSSNTEGKSLIATRIWKSGRIARSFSEIMQKNRHRILHWL